MDPQQLRRILQDVFRASLLAAVVLTSACGKEEIDRDGFESPAFCANEGATPEALRSALGVDWLAIVPGDSGPLPERASGVRCGTAKNVAACEKAIADAQAAPDGRLAPGQAGAYALITSKGDEIRVANTLAELAAMLAPIDSPAKAFHVMWAHGYRMSCDRWVRATSSGFEAIGQKMTEDCNPIVTQEHLVAIARNGDVLVAETVEVERVDGACVGRRPAGLETLENMGDASALGAWLAHAARLEAASVDAFRILARELAFHGAPDELVRASERAARDEVRHAAILGRLARRFGGTFERPTVEPRACRSLFEVARENAVEGCVRETYGAVEAAFQAELACDTRVARAMRDIARDEARHAELAWQIKAWAHPNLTDEEHAAIDAAMQAAAFELRRDVARDVSPRVATIAGVPRTSEATRAVDELAERLWRPARAA